MVEGKDSGIYRVAPLARLNVADGMATPLAHEEYEMMFNTFGAKPVHSTMAMHWARLIEMLYAAEHLLELCQDKEITDTNIRNIPTSIPSVGIGAVEAPRGTLIHHYQTDENGILQKVNLIVATVMNNAAMNMSIKKTAQSLINKNQKANEGLLNMIEMAYRAYDPCLGCATHTLPGQMPLEAIVYDHKNNVVDRVSQCLAR